MACKVSIIMPLYNAALYVSEAIDSVRCQTMENWELIIIDDCSTDSSKDIAESAARLDSRIKVYGNAHNFGASASRSAGLNYSNGRYVAFLDADDVWLPEKLDRQLEHMSRLDCPMCFTAYETIDSNGSFRNIVLVPERLDYSGFLKNTITCSHTVMFDLAKVDKNLLIAPEVEFDFSEDLAVWLQVLRTGVCACGLNDVLAKYRKHSGSRSANKLRAVKRTWATYRRIEKLGTLHSFYCLCFQLAHAVRKRMR